MAWTSALVLFAASYAIPWVWHHATALAEDIVVDSFDRCRQQF
ncbi:hypothetical protein [Mycolicibacterium bacteremicum]|nr:hypothetical protein [Mycolicibacterium bacteremicum]